MRFIPNRNLNRELAAQATYKDALADAAEPAAQAARSIIEAEGYVDTGDLRDGVMVNIDGNEVRIDAMDWKSGFYEFGTVKIPAVAFLARGTRQAGLRLTEK